MRKKSCFFFVLFWLLCVSAPVFAQDAVSATLPAPWTSHLGGQLIYFLKTEP